MTHTSLQGIIYLNIKEPFELIKGYPYICQLRTDWSTKHSLVFDVFSRGPVISLRISCSIEYDPMLLPGCLPFPYVEILALVVHQR